MREMIELTHGNILDADAEALVNTVNCVGIMGRGIALQFKNEFPENYEVYRHACERAVLHPGMMLTYDTGHYANPKYVINFPTKRHWKGNSRIEDIDSGLKALVAEVRTRGIRSIAIPPLGCGLGGLDWDEVRPRIEAAFADLPDVRVLIYEPAGAPAAAEMAKPRKVPNMTTGRAALLGLMRRYLAAVMDPFVSLLEIHKLMYFMQEAGEPLKLEYKAAKYGPYAENLRHVLKHIEGHFITGFGDAADDPTKEIELKPEAAQAAEDFLAAHASTRAHFDRVVDLIEGFETAFAMELLATVHWVGKHGRATSVDEAIAKTYAWNERKRIFKEQHIRTAWQTLISKGWLASG
jgi:O-acetyl-ADP-ribose deacetylase (regulator of RNase III)